MLVFPSFYEGFGNALLETFYFSKPVLVNRYPVFIDDIEPCGFKVISIDGEITDEVVSKTMDLISDKDLTRQWTQSNYDLCGVVTIPDKKVGRGQKITKSAVKNYCISNGIKVLQPMT